MLIKKICISNFKSFKDISVELSNFDVLIGPNASGKSNFTQIFKFLRDALSLGLENAISMQGGSDYIRNINCTKNENLAMKFIFERNGEAYSIKFSNSSDPRIVTFHEFEYEFELSLGGRKGSYKIVKDIITLKGSLKTNDKKRNKSELVIILRRANNRISIEISPEDLSIKKDDILFPYLDEEKINAKDLLLRFIYLRLWYLRKLILNIEKFYIYDFDPRLSKKAIQITGKALLEEDGSNLSIVLRNILANNNTRRQFLDLIKDMLPFVQKIDVDKFADKSILLKLKETYFRKTFLPATFLSDGTINITALIIALFFNQSPFTIIEEPERNIHPHLISKVVSFIRDASEDKQIILTTHNPEIIKHSGVDNLLLIKRDSQGFSTISRPRDDAEVQSFLKNEIGIDELFIQNLL